MKIKAQKLLAFLMSIIMVLQMIPVSSLAAPEVTNTVVTVSMQGVELYDSNYWIVGGSYPNFEAKPFNKNGVFYTKEELGTDPYVMLKHAYSVSEAKGTNTGTVLAVHYNGSSAAVPTNEIEGHPISITWNGDREYTISITQPSVDATLHFYGSNGQYNAGSNTVTGNEAAFEDCSASDEHYYLVAYLKKGNETVGYEVSEALELNGLLSKNVIFPRFHRIDKSINNQPDANTFIYFNEAIHTIEYRLVLAKNRPADYNGAKSATDIIEGYESLKTIINNGHGDVYLKKVEGKQAFVQFNIDTGTLSVSESEKYYAVVTATHTQGSSTYNLYSLIPVVIPSGNTVVNIPITTWYDSNGNIKESEKFTGNEQISVKLYTRYDNTSYATPKAILEREAQHDVTTLVDGSEIKCFTVSYGTGYVDPEDENRYYYPVNLTEITGGIAKSTILDKVDTARDFGVFTNLWSAMGPDMESNIAAKNVTVTSGGYYGFSERNSNSNKLIITKSYTKNGEAYPDQKVIIQLWTIDKKGEEKNTGKTITITTDKYGSAIAEFEGLKSGVYFIKEIVGDKTVSSTTALVQQTDDVTVTFDDQTIQLVNFNIPYNYFETIDGGSYAWLVSRAKDNSIFVVEKKHDKDKLKDEIRKQNENTLSVFQVGENFEGKTFEKINFDSEMQKLISLSETLATAKSSKTVEVINITANDILNMTGRKAILLKNDGRYKVVNIRVNSGGTVNLQTLIGTEVLSADYGDFSKIPAGKVLFNILDENGAPYEGNITKQEDTAGILLAPKAKLVDLEGLFGGTIICNEFAHSGNEVHYNNGNKVNKRNTALKNEIGSSDVGDLELKKDFPSGSNISDRETWFTFVVTLRNAEGEPISDTYSASGLESGSTVTFIDGLATVKVQAQNTVKILGIPSGYTYAVEETTTLDTEQYELISITDDSEGIISTGQTSLVTVVNDTKKAGLRLKKAVTGTDKKDVEFKFDLYLWEESKDKDGKITYKHVNGKYTSTQGEIEFTGGKESEYLGHPAGKSKNPIVLKNGDSIFIQGIKENTHFAFVERQPLVAPYKDLTGVITDVVKNNEFTYNNKYQVGKISVTKVVSGVDEADADKVIDKEFIFTITNKADASITTTLTVKDGETKTTGDLPLGEYTITETSYAEIEGYKLTSKAEDQTVTLTTDGETVVADEFTNVYGKKVGKISVTKVVSGVDEADADKVIDKEFIFTITNKADASITTTLTVKDGETKTTGDLPLGEYTITETSYAEIEGYKLTSKAEDQTVTLTTDGETVVADEFTNVYGKKVGKISVTKVVSGVPDEAIPAEATFTFELRDANDELVETFVLHAGETGEKEGLALGTYTISETTQTTIPGYTFVRKEIDNEEVEITTDGQEISITGTNYYRESKGKISVTKVVSGVPDEAIPAEATFTFELRDANDELVETFVLHAGETGEKEGLALGTYTISETTQATIPGYTFVRKEIDNEEVEITTDGQEISVTGTNYYRESKGKISVTKVVSGVPNEAIPAEATFTFELRDANDELVETFVLHAGETGEKEGLALGTYTISETTQATIPGYTFVRKEIDNEEVEITTDGQEISVTGTNYYVRDIAAKFEAQKTFNVWYGNIGFTFIMEPENSTNPMPSIVENGKVKVTATAEKVPVNFGEITYTLSDLDGQDSKDFKYSIYEDIPADAVNEHGVTYEGRENADANTNKGPWVKNGIEYDDHVYTATVTITKTGNELTSNVTYDFSNDDSNLAPIFKNKYEVSNKTQFFAKKILKGRDSFTDGDFSFILKGDKLPDEGETKYAKADGTPVAFSEITYNQDDLDGVAVTEDAEGNKVRTKTFYYTIQEVIPEEDDEKFDPAITYDTHVENITVTITDDLKGNLDVKVNPENATAAVTFTNIVTKIGKIGNDEEENKISLGGAHLEVWAPNGIEPVDAWTTEAGELHEIEGLEVGTEYTLKETVVPKYPDDDANAPAQYYKFAGDTTFTVDEKGGITVTGDALKLEQVAGETVLMLNNDLAKKPEFEKKIKDTNDSTGETSGWQDSADYDIGDAVPYRLKATLADNVTDYLKYHITFHDVMENSLTFNGVSLVTVNGTDVPAADYVLTSGDHEFDLTLNWEGENGQRIADESLNKAVVEVYFTAILNENAVLGNKGNVNTGKLEYSCNPNVDENGDQNEETEETEEDSVIAFTYLLDVNKLDEGEKKEGSDELQYQPLSGATFKLEKGVITASGTVDWRTYKEFTSDQTGTKFEIKGLDDGIYKLTEKPPKGYKPVDPIIFSVTANHHDGDEWDGTDATRYSILTDLNGALYDVTTGKEITGDVSNGLITFKHLKDNEGLALDVVNKPELTSAVIRKIWNDDDNRDVKRPSSLTLALLADGVSTGKTVILDADNHWADRISGIPMMSHGKKIKYTWAEPSVDGYTMVSNTSENGILTTLTNKYEIEKVKISVKKDWADNENKAGTRPTSIDVQLYADNVAVGGVVTLSADNNWFHTWPELPKNINENGVKREIKYSVNETEIPEGYIGKVTKTISKADENKVTNVSFKITNTYENGKLIIEKEFDIAPWEPFTPDDSPMDIPVIKTWNDNNNKDGNRPASVVVRLLANGTQVAVAELNAGNNWRYTFAGMPRIDENKEKIEYTITEDPVEWYKAQINGFNIRNNYEPELTSVTVTKIWDDANNEMQARPESIVMTLSNGMTVLLNDQNNWTATINDLPTRVNGAPANYTWTEQKVLGYDKVAEVTEGSVTTFMNRRWVRPATPNRGGTPKTAGETVYEFDEYETPLGVDIVINHVGDCFD